MVGLVTGADQRCGIRAVDDNSGIIIGRVHDAGICRTNCGHYRWCQWYWAWYGAVFCEARHALVLADLNEELLQAAEQEFLDAGIAVVSQICDASKARSC